MRLTHKMTSIAYTTLSILLLALAYANVTHAAPIIVVNPGFERPSGPIAANGVIDDVVDASIDSTIGWSKSGGGQIYNPSDDNNASEGENSYLILNGVPGFDLGSGAVQQVLDDVLKVGAYTLSVKVGEDSSVSSAFGTSYEVQLGIINGTGFVSLAQDTALTPLNQFLSSSVELNVPVGDVNLGLPLAIRLVGNVGSGLNNQVLFDDVQLDFVATAADVNVYLQVQRFEKELDAGNSVPMWGYASCNATFSFCASPSETDAPGPRIDAFEGFDLNITVRNTLDLPISIVIPGQIEAAAGSPVMMGTTPDRVRSFTKETVAGIDGLPGAVTTYSWNSLKAGSYLYQSGTFPSIEVPMGLYGAMIVADAIPGTAYNKAFDTESIFLFGEIDPLQNMRVDKADSGLPGVSCVALAEYQQDMTGGYPCTVDYNPKYLLVNGEATMNLPVGDPSQTALLRFLNAGLRSHTPSIVGVELGLIAEDGNAYPGLQRNQSAVLLAAGKTLDAITTLPNADQSFSLFDRMPTFSNENLPAGGSLATLQVGSGTPFVPPPIDLANDDGPFMVTEDTTFTQGAPGVLENDTGLVNSTLISGPSNGTVALSADGSFEYTPNADFSGVDLFIYGAVDGSNNSSAKVVLDVSFVNDSPSAAADSYVNALDSTISVTAPGVLGNDADADGDELIAVLQSGSVSLNPDGSFTASTGGSFTYFACDRPLVAGACPAGSASEPATVDLTINAASGIVLNVQEAGSESTQVSDYRWTVEEDLTWRPDIGSQQTESLATNFHKSYMPVIAQGCVGVTACSEGEPQTPFGRVALDPLKHYYVSVLPADAVAEDADGNRVGHTVGGAPVPPAAERIDNTITVNVNKEPLPFAQISIIVFNDRSPTNGAVDAGEPGLGGFQIALEDAGGRYGISAGEMSQDANGNPLTNALACFEGVMPPLPGVIVSCPDTPANRAAGLVGRVLIQNLFPAKYGIITRPPLDSPVQWTQTSTIEGSKVIDAWVKAGEPPYFAEFGPVDVHAFVGFVSPELIAATNPGGSNTVSGAITNFHLARPPNQTLWDSQTYDALAHTRPWVGLNSSAGVGANIAAVQATLNDDGTATFEIPNVPDGDYQVVVWDAFLDQVIAYRSVSQADLDAGGNIGNVPVFNWFTRLENHVFLDENEDGIRDPGEIPLTEQAVNLRWRDGSVYQSFPTDLDGFVPFDTVFPFFHWLVAEVDYTRFKATGLTVTVDAGGDVSSTGNVLNPQIQGPCTQADVDNGWNGCTAVGNPYADPLKRTETGPVLTQGVQGFLGQTSVFEWGKKPYAAGMNGGISGIVYYGVTRAESDPRLAAAEPWEPGIPGVPVRLYREVARAATSISLINAGFEEPAGRGINANSNPMPGWTKSGGGNIFNPTNNANAAEGSNSYFIVDGGSNQFSRGSGAIEQVLADGLAEGTYRLTVAVGENASQNTVFGTAYRVQLGVMGAAGFILLAEDNSSLMPFNEFQASTVDYSASADDPNLGLPLMVRLTADVVPGIRNQVLFDDVRLNHMSTGLALVQETITDSWDNSLPTGCPGADATDPVSPVDKCYDGLRNFNQARPAVFDGGYAFNDIPAGNYIVEVVPPPGYHLMKEEDVNVSFGDAFAPVFITMPGGAVIPALPDPAMVAAATAPEPGLAQPSCVGDLRQVPLTLSLFPSQNSEAPFALATRPLCDRKKVILSDQGQAAADFTLFTSAPVAGHFTGMILDDVAQEFNPLSPQFGEKWAPPFVPVSIRDYNGKEISRVYSDQWGRMNGLLPSTFTANMPSPSGFSPAMHMTCMNDPGPIPNPDVEGGMMIDPQFDPGYSNFCYTFQYMPGTTTYLDTPVLPVSSFASGDNPADCSIDDATPMISRVRWNNNFDGPWFRLRGPNASNTTRTIVIHSARNVEVQNPAYEGPLASGLAGQKAILRDYGFGPGGQSQGSVTVGGVPLIIQSWNNNRIRARIEAQVPLTGELVVTRGDNGISTSNGVTVTVSADRPIRVPRDFPTIQAAIDNASAGDLILVAPGVYNESIIMWKPVRLQGAGAHSTMINAVNRPTENLLEWRQRLDRLSQAGLVDFLPNQGQGAAALQTSEGAAITVIGIFDSGQGVAPANSFARSSVAARIDGFSITGGTVGGGVLVNSNADRLEISNNSVFGNSGSFNGGIRIGEPFLARPNFIGNTDTFGFNPDIQIRNNIITQNGGLGGAGGGISLAAGSDNYTVSNNFICGNFTTGDGGGIGHIGLSDGGNIAHNRIILNQSFNQAFTVSGGGLFIAGEPNNDGELTLGSGNVDVDFNLIQSNQAGAGKGGGIRTQFVNGQEIVDSANPNNGRVRPRRWHRVRIRDNQIVNNISGWSGGAISLQDTARGVLRRNIIARNDSTATVGGLIVGNQSSNQPAGISTENHSAGLVAVIPPQNNTNNIRLFSNPRRSRNTLWENRSFFYDATSGTAMLVPNLIQSIAGDCPAGAVFWDLDPLLGGAPGSTSPDPGFSNPFCNGGRTLSSTPGPFFALPSLDEGGNAWIDVRFGPLTPAWPAGSPAWSYEVP